MVYPECFIWVYIINISNIDFFNNGKTKKITEREKSDIFIEDIIIEPQAGLKLDDNININICIEEKYSNIGGKKIHLYWI